MDPIDIEWLGCKNEPPEETQNMRNIARSWQWRERGINPLHYPPNKTVLENAAEDILVQKPLKIRSCDLPGYPRSTFLMVFSPDGTKVASTHGNHNVYVSDLASGKHVRILKGHPRTPWCIAFHPSHPQLIGSGCLGGQVRVWDISSGGSEVWKVDNETVIASIAFHPREQLLVIATYNELYFWDWSQPVPFTKVSTNSISEKVRYVAFDALGYKLITGITMWSTQGGAGNSLLQQNPLGNMSNNQQSNRRDDSDDPPGGNRPQDNGSAQDTIVNSYQTLVQRYDSLVRNYQRLFMVRHRLNTNTPPPPSTIDRGTDPMEIDISPMQNWTRIARSTASAQYDESHRVNPTPGTSRRQDAGDSGSESSSSRLLNLDVLSLNNPSSRNQESPQDFSTFGSRSSAFQPINDNTRRSFRTIDQSERTARLLPNPFSSSSTPRPSRTSHSEASPYSPDVSTNTSRTSIFTSSRPEFLSRDYSHRRRNSSFSQSHRNNPTDPNSPPFNRAQTSISTSDSAPSTSSPTLSQRPTMTNSSTQMSPASAPVDAQTINESLDLIRDILRDSGTRLLNLITNMSLSTLASVERSMPPRGRSRTRSDEGDATTRPRLRLFGSSLRRRDFVSSSSDSDSDHSLEVNIFRTRNSTFREDDARNSDRSAASASFDVPLPPTDRMVFELNDDSRDEGSSLESGGFNVSLSNSRFRVRTQSNPVSEDATVSAREDLGATSSRTQSNSEFNPNRPSTSRDNFWSRNCAVPPDEAYRKVRGGVNALQKHTLQLTNMWLQGNRTTMRELRIMWENLRRRILMLHRETGRQDVPSYYTRSLLERCMLLSDNIARSSPRNPRNSQRNEEHIGEQNPDASISSDSVINSPPTRSEFNNHTNTTNDTRETRTDSSPQTRPTISFRTSPSIRRRLHSNYRWRPEDEFRRRSRITSANRLASRYSTRSRRDLARAIEISATRHEIRMRAMQVLSVMFNMMMMCLEERGLSQLIINMLRTLKKALALTCLMLITNRNSGRSNGNSSSPAQRVESLNVVRIQNVDHSGPINVDSADDSISPYRPVLSDTEEERVRNKAKKNKSTHDKKSQSSTTQNNVQEDSASSSLSSIARKWSNRLAVQIAAANRNNSATARNRRELYLESRRLKALHRTNPTAHPLIKKRALPPISTHRIPTLRFSPRNNLNLTNSRNMSSNYEPVAGPSNAFPTVENPAQESPRPEAMTEFEQRVNLIRIAHMQAVRLRNAARNRFRRLQTIRLYTPSSVREMFALQSNNVENQQGSRSPLQNGSELGNRRPFAAYRPQILTPRGDVIGPAEEPSQFGPTRLIAAAPADSPPDVPTLLTHTQRLARIQEIQSYWPAQNAFVLEEGGEGGEGGGGARRVGMAGLLDPGILSEALPAHSHRVQAWDFTTGHTPDIADSTKNVVVQRCRIHNDASIDISKDGRLLVALLPVPRLRSTNHWLGVYSLEWARLGQCLHTAALEQSAVSVALSPTARHLAVGLGSRRFSSAPHARPNVFALLYRLDPLESSSRTGLSPIKELEQNWEPGFTSLNCLRWAPQPGQGLVYANNTGQLIIMS